MAIIRRPTGVVHRGTGLDPFEMMREMLGIEPFRDLAPSMGQEGAFVPDFEVKETSDAFVFQADLPGVKEEDLDVSLQGNRLTVSGKREAEARNEGDTWYTFERSFGSFSRSFTLPREADPDACEASLKDGVLTLRLGKRAEAQPKKISVKGESGGKKGVRA
jgi:HSP20 family protein